jgi:archaeosine-15-forming tRNA-guanine transglycosylase
MSVTIEYELDGETHNITREEYHTERDGYVTAYSQDGADIIRKVKIPEHRVVMIHEINS